MNYFFPICKKPEFTCSHCNLSVPNETDMTTHLLGLKYASLCKSCNDTLTEKVNNYQKDNLKEILKLIETDRDILLAWLLQKYCQEDFYTMQCDIVKYIDTPPPPLPANIFVEKIKKIKESLKIV